MFNQLLNAFVRIISLAIGKALRIWNLLVLGLILRGSPSSVQQMIYWHTLGLYSFAGIPHTRPAKQEACGGGRQTWLIMGNNKSLGFISLSVLPFSLGNASSTPQILLWCQYLAHRDRSSQWTVPFLLAMDMDNKLAKTSTHPCTTISKESGWILFRG